MAEDLLAAGEILIRSGGSEAKKEGPLFKGKGITDAQVGGLGHVGLEVQLAGDLFRFFQVLLLMCAGAAQKIAYIINQRLMLLRGPGDLL